MKQIIIIIVGFFIFSCANKNISGSNYYIQDDNLYGDLKNGIPTNDTLVELKYTNGKLKGQGNFAVAEDEVSILRFGLWKEYDENGILKAEGNYKIGSYLDCCTAGLCRAFYYYRTGEWKYFDEKGVFDFSLNYVPIEHLVDTNCEGGDKLLFGIVKDIPIELWGKITFDKIYELQKISFSKNYFITTLIPLNGKLYYEIDRDF